MRGKLSDVVYIFLNVVCERIFASSYEFRAMAPYRVIDLHLPRIKTFRIILLD